MRPLDVVVTRRIAENWRSTGWTLHYSDADASIILSICIGWNAADDLRSAEKETLTGENRLPENGVLVNIGKHIYPPSWAMVVNERRGSRSRGRKHFVRAFIIEDRQANLLEIV